MKTPILPLALAACLAAPLPSWAAGNNQPMVMPDFNTGGSIPAGANHDWNLGATGACGWIYCDKLVTTDAPELISIK